MCPACVLAAFIRVHSSPWLCCIRSVGLVLLSFVASAESGLSVVSSNRSLLSLLHPRAWYVSLLSDFFLSYFACFSSAIRVSSVISSVRRPISEIPSLPASGVRSFRSPTRVLAKSENVDEVTPVSPSPSHPMSSVTAAAASSAEPASASVDPTMAALFDMFRARSSASIAPPPGPVSTPSGYVSFTGNVHRSIEVATNDLEGVIGASAESSDRLLTSILKRAY